MVMIVIVNKFQRSTPSTARNHGKNKYMTCPIYFSSSQSSSNPCSREEEQHVLNHGSVKGNCEVKTRDGVVRSRQYSSFNPLGNSRLSLRQKLPELEQLGSIQWSEAIHRALLYETKTGTATCRFNIGDGIAHFLE